MYCKKCGKLISDDSVYCKYCGANVADRDEQKEEYINHINDNTTATTNSKKDVNNTENLSNLKKTSYIADEIIANVKMISLALLLWLLYIGGFYIYHSKDIAPVTENNPSYGQGQYDKPLFGVSVPESWELRFAYGIYLQTTTSKELSLIHSNDQVGLEKNGTRREIRI